MAKNDFFVIVYQVLWYLYDCLKNNKPVDMALLDSKNFSIPDPYWEYIMRNLVSEEYIVGVTVTPTHDNPDGVIRVQSNIKITPKGIQYLYDNSLFQKVKRELKDIRAVLPI
jgi:predicted unusual protein kinase regulating ubiquinone biosynthesis (AarF/ABC1/UbiB family)